MKNLLTDSEIQSLNNSYTYHSPSGDQPGRYIEIREKAKELATTIMECCPSSRERSVALTNLEQAVMWANKAIACNEV